MFDGMASGRANSSPDADETLEVTLESVAGTDAEGRLQRADQIVKAAARRAHLFRHGYAINFLNCSGRLDALQEQLGHRDINTTRIYLRLTDEDLTPEVRKVQF